MSGRLVFLGDFSGLSLFLSRGLAAIGEEVELYSNGDGWKGIPRSRELWTSAGSALARGWNQIAGTRRVRSEIRSSDTLVLSTEFLFNRWIDAGLLARLMSKAARTVLLHAGCSDGFHRLNRATLLCQNCKRHDLHSEQCAFDSARWPWLERVLASVDTIVPFTDVYASSAMLYPVDAGRVTQVLPFPVDFEYVGSLAAIAAEKRGATHGLNRPGFKGTNYLHELMERRPSLRREIELLPRMSFVDFVARIAGSELVLDQLFGNCYGMTGCIALANGSAVVFGHTRPEPYAMFLGAGCIPVAISGTPEEDADRLLAAIAAYRRAPCSPDLIRRAAQDRHDHVTVARGFMGVLG